MCLSRIFGILLDNQVAGFKGNTILQVPCRKTQICPTGLCWTRWVLVWYLYGIHGIFLIVFKSKWHQNDKSQLLKPVLDKGDSHIFEGPAQHWHEPTGAMPATCWARDHCKQQPWIREGQIEFTNLVFRISLTVLFHGRRPTPVMENETMYTLLACHEWTSLTDRYRHHRH